MKKLFTKKVLGLLIVAAVALGAADLTVMETSHLRPIIDMAQERAASVFDQDLDQSQEDSSESAE